MKTKLMIAVAVAAVAGTAAFADGFGRGGDMGMRGGLFGGAQPLDFTTLDTDANGSLTLEEINAASATRFAAVDTNGDGTISQDELTAQITANAALMAANQAQMMIARMDANADGVLSADEMTPADNRGPAMMFARLDADADGTVTAEEFAAAQTAMQDHGQGRGQMGQGGHGKSGRSGN